MFSSLFKKKAIKNIRLNLSRDDLVKRGRVLIIDDERPDLIDDLTQARFAVDYVPDIKRNNLSLIDQLTHDLIVLDFGNVGQEFGSDEGLSLLKYIKRVNPSVIVYAYTSKALTIEQSEFYTLTDGSLKKDAGISESTEKIEEGLRRALSIENLWEGLLNVAGIEPGSEEDLDLQNKYVKALKNTNKTSNLRSKAAEFFGSEGAQKIGSKLIDKLLELGFKAIIGE